MMLACTDDGSALISAKRHGDYGSSSCSYDSRQTSAYSCRCCQRCMQVKNQQCIYRSYPEKSGAV